MQSIINNDRYYITCTCGHPSHLLCFDIYHLDNETGIEVYFTSNWKQPWWKRVWYALKFIFQKHPTCLSDSIIINDINIIELEAVIDTIKKYT